jgi:hypothetical protein
MIINNNKNLFTLSVLSAVLLLSGPCRALAANVTGTLIRTINTAKFSPPSPDPSDIAYLSSTDTLLACDGEVEEMPIYRGANLFEMTRSGTLLATYTTATTTAYPNPNAYSNEPVGCVSNSNNGHVFIADDDRKKVYEINPGKDGALFTKDDILTSFSTLTVCGSSDPEGIAYGQGSLFIIDGLNAEVYKVTTKDGIFDGNGESCTHFDTALSGSGVTDPEGIVYDPDNPSHLYVVGRPANRLAHFKLNATGGGHLVRTISIAAANPKNPAGLAAVPKHKTTNDKTHIFIADRRVDNNTDPKENDGKIYQFSVPPL